MAVLKIRLKVIGNVPRGHFLVLWRGSDYKRTRRESPQDAKSSEQKRRRLFFWAGNIR